MVPSASPPPEEKITIALVAAPEAVVEPPKPEANPPKPAVLPVKLEPAKAVVLATPAENAKEPAAIDVPKSVGSHISEAPEKVSDNASSFKPGRGGFIDGQVTVQGRAAEVVLKQSSGFSLLDNAALHAVWEGEFQPARVGSIVIESEIEVPVRFKLAN